MIGASQPASYAYKLGLIHVETGKSRKALQREGLDLLFAKYEKQGILKPSAAESATRILTGDKP